MTTASLTQRVRVELQDLGQPFQSTITADGFTTLYNLPVESVSSAAPLTISVAGVPQGPTTYVVDYKHGTVVFNSAPALNAIINVTGTFYNYFDDDEIAQFVTDAFNLHTSDQSTPVPVLDPAPGQTALPSAEEYPVALLATVEALWVRATEASQEIDIHAPDAVSIPRSQRYRQILQQIAALQDQYQKVTGALGVGLYRIYVLNQRRISRTTNRYVPVYQAQEYDAPYAGFSPTQGLPGTMVTINGTAFTGATAVQFGGVSATSFTIVSDTLIQAVVPNGALTGQISIVTPYGTAFSTASFVVGQPTPTVLYGPNIVRPPIPTGI